jgi:O-palmitoleoyl-L-serine hydrolase
MASAKQVVLKGCSAGGLATYLHADYFGSKLSPSTRFVAAPGAGFFLDAPSITGDYLYTPNYEYIYTMQNVSAYGKLQKARC